MQHEVFIIFFTTERHLFLSPQKDESSSHLPSHIFKVHSNILPYTPRSCKLSLSLRFPTQIPVYISLFPPHLPKVPSNPSSWIWSLEQYLVMRINGEDFQYAVLSSLLLLFLLVPKSLPQDSILEYPRTVFFPGCIRSSVVRSSCQKLSRQSGTTPFP